MSLVTRKSMPARRGVIFVAALGITVVLSGLLLVFSQEMRTEAIASANRVSDAQAAAVEQAAEQWVLAQLTNDTDPITLDQLNCEGLFVGSDNSSTPGVSSGGGYFWIIKPNPDDTTYPLFGLVDESSKLSINIATADMLQRLPGVTNEIANSIVEWRGGSSGGVSAGSAYYNSLPDPYSLKKGSFESLDELLLIKDVTNDLLYGKDRNHDGVLSYAENAGTTTTAAAGNDVADDGRGIAQYLTCWSLQNTPRGGAGGGQAAAATVQPLVNVNSASKNVLIAMGMSSSQADQLINSRSSSGSITGTQLVQQAPSNLQQYMTGNASQFSADIVAVSADGRGYRRVKMVVDIRSTPFTILYRKDLTNLGFPLPPEIRENLRAGKGLEGVVSR